MKFSTTATLLLSAASAASAFAPSSQQQLCATTTQLDARKPFITGNWKLNPQTKDEAIALATGVADSVTGSSPGDVAVFVPFPFLDCVNNAVGDRINVGAEVRVHGGSPMIASQF